MQQRATSTPDAPRVIDIIMIIAVIIIIGLVDLQRRTPYYYHYGYYVRYKSAFVLFEIYSPNLVIAPWIFYLQIFMFRETG